MIEHSNHSQLFQDDNMLEPGKDVIFISASKHTDFNEDEQRVYAKYEKGDWITEAQVLVDGEWYVENRNKLYKPNNESEYSSHQNRVVESNHTMFSNLSKFWRIILTPVYGIIFMYFCLTGKDINLQILGKNRESE